jgi:hypothetical protein
MQLLGYGLTPFVTEMQTLLLSALFYPLNARISILQCLVNDVRSPPELPRMRASLHASNAEVWALL